MICRTKKAPPFFAKSLLVLVECLLHKLILVLGTLPLLTIRGVQNYLQYDLQYRLNREVIVYETKKVYDSPRN